MAFSGENAESYYDDGLTASVRGDLDRAIACFEKAIQLDPGLLVARHQLAKCCLRQGNSARAVELLQQVVRRNPKQIPPRIDIGHAFLGAGYPDRAQEQFEQVVSHDPQNGRAHLGLARVHFEKGNWQAALDGARRSLDLTGAGFANVYLVGRAAKLAGKADLAEESLAQADALLERSVEMHPEQPENHFLRGEVAVARDRFSTALEHYRGAEDRAEQGATYAAFGELFTFVDILARQGGCYERLDRLERARDIGQRILRIDPEHALGKALAELG